MPDRTHELSVEIGVLLLKLNPMNLTPRSVTRNIGLEARELGPLLENCRSESEATDIVYAVFKRFFNPLLAGDRSRYEAVGHEIWNCRQRMKEESVVDHSSELLAGGDF